MTANRQTHLFCFINYAGHKITFVHCSPLESFLWFPLKKQPQHYTKNVCGMWYYRIKMLQFCPYFFKLYHCFEFPSVFLWIISYACVKSPSRYRSFLSINGVCCLSSSSVHFYCVKTPGRQRKRTKDEKRFSLLCLECFQWAQKVYFDIKKYSI